MKSVYMIYESLLTPHILGMTTQTDAVIACLQFGNKQYSYSMHIYKLNTSVSLPRAPAGKLCHFFSISRILGRRNRRLCLPRLYPLAIFFGILTGPLVSATAATNKVLENNQWSMISLPSDPGPSATVQTVFADDLPASTYGVSGQWVMYGFNPVAGAYVELTLADSLEAAKGYWMIQATGSAVALDVPAAATEFTGIISEACPSPEGCIATSLSSDGAEETWHLLGRAGDFSLPLSSTRVFTENDICNFGCSPTQANSRNLMHDHFFSYDEASGNYLDINQTQFLEPWSAYWVAVLPRTRLLPGEWLQPIFTPGTTSVTTAQRDAARLLNQASFGPTEDQINRVIQLGGASAWIDDQLAKSPTLHLPVVNARFPDVADGHIGRYYAFWDHALRAEDQLRQRVAFALSEIMVVSDRSNIVGNHGQSLTAYYDVLVNNAFGNFRTLIEQVTLSPAMGVYLSMLANSKPDNATGRRADENYAREIMQLFTIGLVELNEDGTPKEGEPATYTQTDVENLARIFTGWSWNALQWEDDPRNGWRRGENAFVSPMKAFAAHHDMDEKIFLNVPFAAGQTAQEDLAQSLNLLSDHPNVGPFISRQLIQRLVTSNPSNAYVARVAAVFDRNAGGERGDLGAVVKAILMDDEARSTNTVQRSDYGKLREPVLRLSHLWRAFNMQDDVNMGYNNGNQLSQHAPLTANSVFNFFSPTFSPQGAMRDAKLVAPEFQINSETTINNVNTTFMNMIQDDSFNSFFPARLDLDAERALLDSPQGLINRLDLVLFAGDMPPEMRRLLVRYLAENDDPEDISRERLLRDVVALTFLSADYVIQR